MGNRLLRCFTVLALLALTNLSSAQTTTTPIFSFGAAWKYLDDGSNQGTAWNAAAFNDAAWATGTGHIGYGETWTTTCIRAGATCPLPPNCNLTNTCNKYITAYLRKTINITDVNLLDSVRFSVFMDDGIVMYVNGVEVWRNNMPTGVVAFNTLASGNIPESTAVTRSIPISYFTTGNNVIAVEVHQNAVTTSDMDFNAQAIGIIKTSIFPYGSAWKYFTTASDPGTSWLTTGFNDAAWPTGTGHIGFGETWTTTCIPPGVGCTPGCIPGSVCTKYNTAYFRKSITLPDVSLYDSLRFSVFRDDGIVMYVNGTEVWRDNMPAAPAVINYNTFAPLNVGADLPESTAVAKSIPISYFTNGTNVIAIEVHETAPTSSDLDFNVQTTGILHVPPAPVTLSQGPYLQMGNQSAVSIRWRTNVASKSRVQVGTVAGTYPVVVNDATALTEHELRVTGLTADTKYFYRIGTDTSIIQGDTTNFFVTAPTGATSRRVTVAAFGDCGRNDNNFQTTTLTAYQNYLAAQNLKAADLMLLIGDNAYDAGTDAEFSANFFSRYSSNILKNHMLFPAPGNHDYANDATRQADHNIPYYNLFTMPSAGQCGGVASGTEAYYSYNWGDIHFLSLDSYGEENAGTTRLYDTLGAQVTWIKNDLAVNTKKWTVAYWHHPPYTMGGHNSNTETELVNIRQNFIRILERYGVDVIICGHTHAYERSYLLKGHYGNEASFNKAAHTADSSSAMYNGSSNSCPYTIPSGQVNHGTVYVVAGSAGADGTPVAGFPHDALPFAIDDGGMFFLDIKDNRLDAKFIRRDNTIGDQFTIMKDVKVRDTIALLYGSSVNLTASWPGAYAWGAGVTTRSVTVTPLTDTLITVKDSLTHTCITDQHYIDVQCTMPAFTSCPANIVRSGCNAVINYSVADTARPAPALTYSFSGATAGSGNGSGSGTLFSIGVTTVTVTATNSCGSTPCTFTVTVNPLPVAYNTTGGGHYCSGAAGLPIGLDGSETGVNYQLYNGATPIGSPLPGTGAAISFGTFTTAAVYTVLATQTATGCTTTLSGSPSISIDPLPSVYSVTGGGHYCAGGAGVGIGLSNSQTGISYQLYNGSTATGTPIAGTATSVSFGLLTTPATYTVVAANTTTGCTSNMAASATVVADPVPLAYNSTGGGHYCSGAAGLPIGLDGSEAGIKYQLYNGATTVGSQVSGTGAAFSFGTFTTAAVYTVLATQATTGCTTIISGSPSISIDPLPSVYALTGGGHYCEGNSVAIGISNSQTGINYQLYNGAATVGTAVAGTAGSLSFGNFTTAATYTVAATNATTGCMSNMTGSAIVVADPLPLAYSITGGGHYCSGGSGMAIALVTSQTGINYTLYRGATVAGSTVAGTGSAILFGSLTPAGTYTVLAANATTGCTNGMTGSAAIVVDPLPIAYNVNGSGAYCAGGSGLPLSLSNSEAGISYQLYRGTTAIGTFTGTGAPLAFGTYTAAGTYTVIATNTATTCTANMTTSAVVIVNPLPAVYAVTGGGAYCAGSPGVHIGLGGSATGVNYQLYRGTTAVGTTTPGTGLPLDYGLLATAGTYSVAATNATTSCGIAMVSSVPVSITPTVTPAVSLSASTGTTVCTGTPVTFTPAAVNGGAAPAYRWYVNGAPVSTAATHTYTPTNGNIISVKLTSNATCTVPDTAVATLTMTVNPYVMPNATIAAVPGNILCQGSPVTFTATTLYGGSSPAFTWLKNSAIAGTGTTFSYTPADGDDVMLSMASNHPCRLVTATYSNSIGMTIAERTVASAVDLVVKPGIYLTPGVTDTITATISGGGANPTYQWVKNGVVISGASTNTYISSTLAEHDSLACVVTGTGICGLTNYNFVIFRKDVTGISNVPSNDLLTIRPNPTTGTFVLTGMLSTDQEIGVTITNAIGQVLYRDHMQATNGEVNHSLTLGDHLPDGIYFVSVNTATGNKIFRVTLKR